VGRGLALSSAAAADLALSPPDGGARGDGGPPAPGSRGTPPAGRHGWAELPAGTLTPREREVVALIARGASNKDIADELYISPATAARHVANILGKLGYTSRSQVAAWSAAANPGRGHTGPG